MRTIKIGLFVALFHQIYRGTVLTVATLLLLNSSASLSLSDMTLVLAATATSLVPAVLLLQLYLTNSPILLPPARIAKLLETIGSMLAVATIFREGGLVFPLGVAAIGDVIVLVFLLLYPRDDGEPGRPSSLPTATIEELEDE